MEAVVADNFYRAGDNNVEIVRKFAISESISANFRKLVTPYDVADIQTNKSIIAKTRKRVGKNDFINFVSLVKRRRREIVVNEIVRSGRPRRRNIETKRTTLERIRHIRS